MTQTPPHTQAILTAIDEAREALDKSNFKLLSLKVAIKQYEAVIRDASSD
jgi:hypothetical protein